MKKIVLTYGLIAGAVMGIVLSLTTPFMCDPANMGKGMIVGYTTMLLALTLVFVGTKNYRDKFSNGTVTFGRAFGVGILISLVAAVIYSIAWLIIQHFMIPDFYEMYATKELESVIKEGATAKELADAQANAELMKSIGNNPIAIFFFTLLEPLPVGLLVTLVTALILKKKPAPSVQ
jgi:hypothetical protein